jgi:hypothetical protein
MLNLVDLPGFKYGNPPAVSLWYGLWCPLTDCFILVSYDLKQLKQIQALTVSKLLTVLVELDPQLYQNNTIDNLCACDWTLTDSEAINFTLVLKKEFCYNSVKQIQPSVLKNPQQVKKIQTWFIFVWYWVDYIDRCLSNSFNELVASVFDISTVGVFQKEIYKILLLEHDPSTAEEKIKKVLTNHV